MRLNYYSSFVRRARPFLTLTALPLLSGCSLVGWAKGVFRLDGRQSTLWTEGPVADEQRQLFYLTCYVTFAIFVVVAAVLAYATIKFKARTEADEHAEPPPQGHGNPLVEVGLIGGTVLALVIILIPTLQGIFYTYDVPQVEKGNAYEVTATGFQWWFRFEYPSEQIPGAGNLTTANELVIPAGRPIHVNLRANDVMHSFWVPKLAGKVDMIPNRGNFLWLEARTPGYFWGQCAEYCGDSHALMRFRVIALSPRDFEEWLTQQEKPARAVTAPATAKVQLAALPLQSFEQNEIGFSNPGFDLSPLDVWRSRQFPDKDEDPDLIAKGRQLFQEKTCVACHVIRGQQVGGSIAYPDLTHVGARTTIAGGVLENNPLEMRRWIHNPSLVKPGNKMWEDGYLKNNIHLTPDDEVALVAYLQSLR